MSSLKEGNVSDSSLNPSPSTVPETLQVLTKVELKEKKDFYSKDQTSEELAFNFNHQSQHVNFLKPYKLVI